MELGAELDPVVGLDHLASDRKPGEKAIEGLKRSNLLAFDLTCLWPLIRLVASYETTSGEGRGCDCDDQSLASVEKEQDQCCDL